MNHRLRTGSVLTACWIVLGLVGAASLGTGRVRAGDGQPPGPDRVEVVVIDYISYEWWLAAFDDNEVICQIFIDHEGLPTGVEIYSACGEEVYDDWAATQPCETAERGDPSTCSGYYLLFVQDTPAQREIGLDLPPPVVWVTLDGCLSVASTNRCRGLPSLVLTGEEPLPNEEITRLEGNFEGEPFVCDPLCQIDLAPTDEDGLTIEFWAYSSYGDSSEVFEALVRVSEADPEDPDNTDWFVDVLSTQWRGTPAASCAQSWGAFPPVGGPSEWLLTPESPQDLASNIPYEYLAGNLIAQGVVDASACPGDGLLPNGLASPCGLEVARPAVDAWQDRFDAVIFEVALDTGVPAQLLKNLFSRESQFWPGIFTNRPEVGLGQMTENGADTALLWNPSFFEQFCPLVLEESLCRQGYPQLGEEEQAMLRGALVRSVDAFCPDCPLGIDLRQVDFSIAVFAETLMANCEQAGRIVRNTYNRSPGQVSTYEDLWRFTLVNYNAGPGCLMLAVMETRSKGERLDWEHLSLNLTPVCQGAIDYVEDISR